MIGNYNVRSIRQWCVHDFTYWIQTTNAESITPKNENIEAVFFCFLERNDANEKRKQHNRPKKENEGNVYLP